MTAQWNILKNNPSEPSEPAPKKAKVSAQAPEAAGSADASASAATSSAPASAGSSAQATSGLAASFNKYKEGKAAMRAGIMKVIKLHAKTGTIFLNKHMQVGKFHSNWNREITGIQNLIFLTQFSNYFPNFQGPGPRNLKALTPNFKFWPKKFTFSIYVQNL